MKARPIYLILLGLLIALLSACTHAISPQIRETAATNVTPESLLGDFANQKGKLVMMGGDIVETRNLEKETVIEVIQKPLSRTNDWPMEDSKPNGRFLVRYNEFRDPYVYSKGRQITVAGTVVGKEKSKIDQQEYTYIVLQNRETYLWPKETPYSYYGYPYPYYYGYWGYPYWPGYPWYPYWYPHYRRPWR